MKAIPSSRCAAPVVLATLVALQLVLFVPDSAACLPGTRPRPGVTNPVDFVRDCEPIPPAGPTPTSPGPVVPPPTGGTVRDQIGLRGLSKADESALSALFLDEAPPVAPIEGIFQGIVEQIERDLAKPPDPPVTTARATPPPPAVTTPPVATTKLCGPRIDEQFADAVRRTQHRLYTLFGLASNAAVDQPLAFAFLLANGWDLDFWVISAGSVDGKCPSGNCTATVTLCGRCHPQHILSDFLYGFVAGYLGLTEAHVDLGGWVYQASKWVAKGPRRMWSDSVTTPEHVSEARPAYHAGIQLGQEWQKRPGYIELPRLFCESDTGEHLGAVAIRNDCQPCASPCIKPDRDWSLDKWVWETPDDTTARWAKEGYNPPR